MIEALRAVEAWDWVERLPQQLDTVLGSGNTKLTPAQAQQIALARLVVADPHTLVLDEATSLIDPQTARHLEGSMAALLLDRTVVAIAHRLHTAHDADRIAVVIDGRIAELGSHARAGRRRRGVRPALAGLDVLARPRAFGTMGRCGSGSTGAAPRSNPSCWTSRARKCSARGCLRRAATTIAVAGRAHHGPNNGAGEWGHNPLPQPDVTELPGPVCYCGRHGDSSGVRGAAWLWHSEPS